MSPHLSESLACRVMAVLHLPWLFTIPLLSNNELVWLETRPFLAHETTFHKLDKTSNRSPSLYPGKRINSRQRYETKCYSIIFVRAATVDNGRDTYCRLLFQFEESRGGFQIGRGDPAPLGSRTHRHESVLSSRRARSMPPRSCSLPKYAGRALPRHWK
jgi:hypothetical protein